MTRETIDLIVTWAPFLVLVAVGLVLVRRMNGGTTWQNQCLQQMKAQTEAQEQIARHADRIATALEQRGP